MNGGCYKVVSENLNWTDAGSRCRELNKDAHLLVINDAAEQSAIAWMFSSLSSQYRFYRAMHFSAFARSCDRMSSVRPSVRLSVCNVGDL